MIYYLIWGLQSWAFGKIVDKIFPILQNISKYVQLMLKIAVTKILFSSTTYT